MLQIDDIDRQLLELLQGAGRMTNRDLAKKVGLSPAPCWHRVKRLEQTGLIARYAAVLDSTLAGQNFRALVGITLISRNSKTRHGFEDQVRGLANVQECYWISGKVDYQLMVTAADLADFENFLEHTLLAIPGVSNAFTQVALKEIKRTTVLPLDAIEQKSSQAVANTKGEDKAG
jgi:Lrp/AsnC family transcriptional regulator, leucine-responsive regulatory protein